MKSIPARVAAFRANGADRYGLVTDNGIIDLTPEFGARFRSLKEVIEAGALEEIIKAAEGRSVAYREEDVDFLIPIDKPEKLICIGVNFPDRNAEYKDGPGSSVQTVHVHSVFRAASPATAAIWYVHRKPAVGL